MKTKKISTPKVMYRLSKLLGNLRIIMSVAVFNGVLGFLSSIGITILGSISLCKFIEPNFINIKLEILLLLTVILGFMRGILRYFEQYSNHYIAFKILAVIRNKIYNVLKKLAPAKLENKKKGDLISMLTADIETLEVYYAHTISPFMISILTSLILFSYIGLVSNWYFAILYILGVVVIGFILPIISHKSIIKIGEIYRRNFSNFNAYFFDSIKGIREIKLYNKEIERTNEIDKRSNILINNTNKLNIKNHITFAFINLFISIFILLSLILSIILYKNYQIPFNKIILANIAFASGFGPVVALANLPSNLNQTFSSARRVINLIDEKPEVELIENKNDIIFDNLEVSNLSFSYDNKKEILNDVSFKVKKGEIISIIGESGSGKSTILKLILRYYNVSKGNIKYNSININDINTKSLLNNVTLVFQSTYLFDDSIYNNIKMGINKNSEDVINACKKASIHDFITTLDEKYETKLNSINENISAGEKQRIGLARAFLKDSPLIIFDEPTSNVDSINEGIILKSILEQKKDKAIIIISHRKSTINISDRCYYLNNGVLTEK